ncbi:potassium-transporting ATPase subunit KdpA [Frateuria aurantia]
MTAWNLLQVILPLLVIGFLVRPLGGYMAMVFDARPRAVHRWGGWAETAVYRMTRVDPNAGMDWRQYAAALLSFNVLGLLAVYALQRMQAWLPFNPGHVPAVGADLAFNTAVSFASNTDWQAYAGETVMSYGTGMLGLTVQNFLSAASGMAVLLALIRGFAHRGGRALGNFWQDMTRSVVYVLLPLSCVLALALVSQGVVQNLQPAQPVHSLAASVSDRGGAVVAAASPVIEHLPMGPAASQIAIKQLGTNGGGFFNANSAHPYENPTPLSNFLELVAILLIPAALCYTFGVMIGQRKQGWALLAVMAVIFLPLCLLCVGAEQAGNPALHLPGLMPGGNMEGKETRLGIAASAIWATATSAASNGSVNAMLDSFTPLGGLVPMWLIQLGEVVFGGVGSGLYGMLAFAVIAVFMAGLMVGRTPEYLGKKIQAYEMKMASLAVLVPCALAVVGTAVAVVLPAGQTAVSNPGPHGFSEILYAVSSAANNNGSAFGGLNAGTPFWNLLLAVCMFLSRYLVAVAMLAMAGALAAKPLIPPSAGTLPTHTPLFIGLLAGVVLVVGALTFVPALALGPIAEYLMSVR